VSFPDITPELKAAMPELRGRLLANQSLAELTWFRVGGPAQVLFTPVDEDDLAYFLKHLPDDLPVYVVGVGSNLIVRDGGLPGVVIRLAPRGFGETGSEGDIVTAGAAALDKRVAETAAAANLAGLEFYFGIPGTIGGALRMNAGANGAETKDVLMEAAGIDRKGNFHTYSNADMRFVYRNCGVDPSIIFTSARFRGKPAEPEAIRARMNEVQTHRETAQPIREKTGGSTFKNPPNNSAWKLIDAAGCRGLKLGSRRCTAISSSTPVTRPAMILRRLAKPCASASNKIPELSYIGKSSGSVSSGHNAHHHSLRRHQQGAAGLGRQRAGAV
jgi:UDP-N-acetylmuramate dehydrogenase